MRTWIFGAALAAAVAIVCPPAHARIVDWGDGAAVTCGTTATLLNDATLGAVEKYLVVCNPSGGGIVYLGGDGVTTATGLPLRPGDCFNSGERVDKADGARLYCVAPAATSVRVLGVR